MYRWQRGEPWDIQPLSDRMSFTFTQPPFHGIFLLHICNGSEHWSLANNPKCGEPFTAIRYQFLLLKSCHHTILKNMAKKCRDCVNQTAHCAIEEEQVWIPSSAEGNSKEIQNCLFFNFTQ